jgi:hypothetical protein
MTVSNPAGGPDLPMNVCAAHYCAIEVVVEDRRLRWFTGGPQGFRDTTSFRYPASFALLREDATHSSQQSAQGAGSKKRAGAVSA